MNIKVGDRVKITNINLNHWNEDEDSDSYLNKIGIVEGREPDSDYGILVRFTEDNLKTIYFYENELEIVNTEELSSIEFLMSTVTRENGFTPKFIEALADVCWKAEKYESLKKQIESHDVDGRNYTNGQYVQLLNENQRLYDLLNQIAELIDENRNMK